MSALDTDRPWALFFRDGKSVEEIAEILGVTPDEVQNRVNAPINAIVSRTIAMVSDNATQRVLQYQKQADKIVENVLEANASLREKLKAERKRKSIRFIHELPVEFKRNENRWAAIKLGLREGIWNAPYHLLRNVGGPLTGVIATAVMCCIGAVVWVFQRGLILFNAARGRLVERKTK